MADAAVKDVDGDIVLLRITALEAKRSKGSFCVLGRVSEGGFHAVYLA
jgi:hypothetical protein